MINKYSYSAIITQHLQPTRWLMLHFHQIFGLNLQLPLGVQQIDANHSPLNWRFYSPYPNIFDFVDELLDGQKPIWNYGAQNKKEKYVR